MTGDQLDRALRDTLRTWPYEELPGAHGVADQVARTDRRLKMFRRGGAILAIAGIGVGAALATAAGGDTDGGLAPPAGVEQSPPLQGWSRWQMELPGGDTGTCLTAEMSVYCSTMGYDGLRIDARSGKVVWTSKSGGSSSGGLGGFRDGVLYTFRDHKPGSNAPGTDLVALEAKTKKVLWKHKLASDNRDAQAAVPFNGGVLANAPRDRVLRALDPKTGRTEWTYSWGKGIWCDRTTLDGVPYLLCRPDGADLKGDTDVIRLAPADGGAQKIATVPGHTEFLGSSGDDLVFVRKDRKLVHRVSTQGGGTEQRSLAGVRQVAGLAGDVLLSSRPNGEVTGHSTLTGKRLWTTDLGLKYKQSSSPWNSQRLSTPALMPGTHTAYLLSPSGKLAGADLRTGKPQWHGSVRIPTPPKNAPTSRPQLLTSGDVLVGRAGTQLFSERPDPSG
ncbi:PQQ-binding-like beta-propeller repeat protein [Streptomyces sp. A7024]|uniref:PQQ-binding-like beta-propeller repeat protein n=1 Tax=Streptomyces coryli TaxID=1128680 RepID=A0A6G4U358_9ACTN|nr:PQQ-binding-like beta-propeller repeat protein [Streptomyces coryli]NGN66665.1 PQQ-binding-like beta-propeller repeat protein [Streptomyces coryli]